MRLWNVWGYGWHSLRTPTHLLLPLTVYGRDILEDMKIRYVGKFIIIHSSGHPPQKGKIHCRKVTKLQNRIVNNKS
jgi:hypothetical protein